MITRHARPIARRVPAGKDGDVAMSGRDAFPVIEASVDVMLMATDLANETGALAFVAPFDGSGCAMA